MLTWKGMSEPQRKFASSLCLAASELIFKVGLDEFIKLIEIDDVLDILDYHPRVKQRMIELRLIDDK